MGGCIYLIEAVGYGFYKIGRAEEITARFPGLVEAYQPIELRLRHVIARDTGNYPFSYHWDAAQSKWVLEELHAHGQRIDWY